MSRVFNHLVHTSSSVLVLLFLVVAMLSQTCEARRYSWSGRHNARSRTDSTSTPLSTSDPPHSDPHHPADPFLLLGQTGDVRTPSGVRPPGRAWTARNALADLVGGALPDPAIPGLDTSSRTLTSESILPRGADSRGTTPTSERILDQALARLFVRYVRLKQANLGKRNGDYIRSSLQLFRALCQLLNQKDPNNTFCFSIFNRPPP